MLNTAAAWKFITEDI